MTAPPPPLHLAKRSLDEWYRVINRIFLDRNFYRDSFSIFAHLVEVVGGLSVLASDKHKPEVTAERFVPKALAWWLTLCGKAGVRSVEQMLWWKFPYACPYCQRLPHQDDICQEAKLARGHPDWDSLENLGRSNEARRPRTLDGWQTMFSDIYPVTATESYPPTFARFTEELGELAEALRVFPLAPGYFLSEAADVFAWLMHLQNLHHKQTRAPVRDRGKDLVAAFVSGYPDRCGDCGGAVCTCPPILPSTLGRIGHEVPAHRASFSEGGALLPVDEAMELFRAAGRSLTLGTIQFEVDARMLSDIRSGIEQLISLSLSHETEIARQSQHLLDVLYEVKKAADGQRLTDDLLDELASEIADLDAPARSTVLSFLVGLSSSVWATALVDAVRLIAP